MPIPYETDQHREILEILCTIVRQKLYQYLRYELGITYDIQMTYTGDGLHIDGGFIKEKEQEGIEVIHQVLDDFSKEDFKVNLERVKKITIKRLFPNISNPKLINDLLGLHWLS